MRFLPFSLLHTSTDSRRTAAQARKAIEAGTIQLNGVRIPPKSHQRTITETDLLDGRLVVVKAGKTAHKAVLLE